MEKISIKQNRYVSSGDEFHIGSLIFNKLKERRISVSSLAQQIHCERANVYKIFNRVSIDSAQLLKISLALNTNFFTHYSETYKAKKKNKKIKK